MTHEDLQRLLNADSYTASDLEAIDLLEKSYPWFGLAGFLRLRILRSLGREHSPQELERAVLFSSDPGHLYRWIQGEKVMEEGAAITGSALEFIDDFGEEESDLKDFRPEQNDLQTEASDLQMEDPLDADSINVREKEESEMEEPEIEESMPIPVMDQMEEDEEFESLEDDADPLAAASVTKLPAEEGPVSEQQVDLLLRGTMEADGKSDDGPKEDLIEQFLQTSPGVIKADKETTLEGDISSGSVQEDDSFITDTLAKIYVKQGLHAKAIYAYERLSLKYPEKSAYFAAQIEKIKNLSHL